MRHVDEAALFARLERDRLIRRVESSFRTTTRWQGAMMRAAATLYSTGDPGGDLRVPVALALVNFYGAETPDEELVELIAIMAPIEARELTGGLTPPAASEVFAATTLPRERSPYLR